LQHREKSGGGRFFAAFRGGTATGRAQWLRHPVETDPITPDYNDR